MDDLSIKKALSASKTIAVVGCSATPGKAAHEIPRYLQAHGYRIVPINPNSDNILGEKAYPSLQAIPKDITIDIIDIFRPAKDTPQIVRQAISLSPRPKLIWLQSGITSEESAKIAETHKVPIIMNHCIMVEHRRLL